MADPRLRQDAGNAVGSRQSRTCRATLTRETRQNALVVLTAVAGSGSADLTPSSGDWVLIRSRSQGGLKVVVWYWEGAPSMSSASVSIDRDASLQVRILEYEDAAQSGALDRVTVQTSTGREPRTGSSGLIAQSDEIVVTVVANRYASTTQGGFSGGLAQLIEQVSPSSWGGFLGALLGLSDPDEARTRLTIHQAIASQIASFALSALLSAVRDWICILITFRGASSGPARMTSTARPALSVTGTGRLTVFGPLTALDLASTGAALRVTGVHARMGPFAHQYLIGGWNGLLIGAGTPWRVESVEGLEGWDVRTSDDELPRGDGALRGVDLQAARQILFRCNFGNGDPRLTEELGGILFRALVPQRDQDFDLIWRHPGLPLQLMRVRPTNLIKESNAERVLLGKQAFSLRGADPRHYGASEKQVTLPVTPAGSDVLVISVVNLGNGPAYPLIRVSGPTEGEPVSRVEVANTTNDQTFAVAAILPRGATLRGDMEARATGAPRSVVTIDGQTKYGAWQNPRQTFQLNPGANLVTLRTVPAGAPVRAELVYRDTSSG